VKISFKCDKDPVLAEHYDKTFRKSFEEDIAETGLDPLSLLAYWNPQMLAEALVQEHWDFELVGEPTDPAHTGVSSVQKRKPVLGDDGRPTLLIPTIVFE
jgi:hypothetical protein